jgi:hypothetical protein
LNGVCKGWEGGGNREIGFHGYRISVEEEERVPEDSSDGCTMVIYLILQNYILKNS